MQQRLQLIFEIYRLGFFLEKTDRRLIIGPYKAIVYMMQNFKQLSGTPQIWLNTLACLYADAGEYLTALSFLEEALAICETNRNTLSPYMFDDGQQEPKMPDQCAEIP